MTDPYTRLLLTVIAISLAIIAVRGVSPIPAAFAGEVMECKFSGGLEVSRFSDTLDIRVTRFDSDLDVEVKSGFSQPGTSASSPIYVQDVN